MEGYTLLEQLGFLGKGIVIIFIMVSLMYGLLYGLWYGASHPKRAKSFLITVGIIVLLGLSYMIGWMASI